MSPIYKVTLTRKRETFDKNHVNKLPTKSKVNVVKNKKEKHNIMGYLKNTAFKHQYCCSR